ncbi:MAG: hypothetical protein ACI9HE_000984 [Planctomycetota bacterium]|jgi:hypothetical protein
MSAIIEARAGAILNHLIAWAQEEVACQEQLLVALGTQAKAAHQRMPEAIEESTEGVDACLAGSHERSMRRERLFHQLGVLWGVAPRSLSLTSILLRAGEGYETLAELRDQLRVLATQVRTTGRKVQNLLRLHQRITTEIIDSVLGDQRQDSLDRSGALLDAEV